MWASESLPSDSPDFNGNLFQKMAVDLRLAGKSKRTVYGYQCATGHLVRTKSR
jgi:hypothetical protein